jgi:predicted  nucleic acid-binding Zn-ribbon protein
MDVPPPGRRTYDEDVESPGASPVVGGLSSLRARLGRKTPVSEEDNDKSGEERALDRSGSRAGSAKGGRGTDRSGDEYYDKMSFGRASVASDRSNPLSPTTTSNTLSNSVSANSSSRAAGGAASSAAAAAAAAAEVEKVRADYELKIAQMQSRLTTLERSASSASDAESRARDLESLVRKLEDELRAVKKRAEEEANAMRILRRELDSLRDERGTLARRAGEDADEIQSLRDTIDRLQSENKKLLSRPPPTPKTPAMAFAPGVGQEVVEQLRSDMEGLLGELGDLQGRNDELMDRSSKDTITMRELREQVREMKKKYEAAKTELRSAKGASPSLFYSILY